jgi:hypothetical protein
MTDAPGEFAPCDHDRNGTECAAVAVYTRTGQIQLCGHHFRQNRSAFPPDYVAVPMRPDRANLPQLAVSGRDRSSKGQDSSLTGHHVRLSRDITYTMRDHW